MNNLNTKSIIILSLVILLILFIGYKYTNSIFNEPTGKPVILSPEELNTKYMKPYKREWYGWHRKGLTLAKEGYYEEALYCYNMAIKAWPKEKDKDDPSKIRHFKEPTDTLLQKAELYLKMNKPELALKYFKKFDSYLPNEKFTIEGMRKAKLMIESN